MPVDTSIYSSIKPPENNFNPVSSVESALKLSDLAMKQQQLGYQMQQQGAIRGALARNTDTQTGQLDRTGVLSDLYKTAPQAAMQMEHQFAASDKAQAEAKTAQMVQAHNVLSVTLPALQYLKSLEQAQQAYPQVMQGLKDQGIPLTNTPPDWDRKWADQGIAIGSRTKEGLENAILASNVAMKPAELNAALYGSRSPNAELTTQYDKQAQPVRQSQMAMQQMLQNYKDSSPQGDASLVLNAFKIKFPNAPDVNSLAELSHAEGVTNQMKNWVSEKQSGIKDPEVRADLMRDGIATYEANVRSLQGTQQRYQARAAQQNVNDPTMTYEPAVNQTYNDAMNLKNQIGPYVPPSGGVTGALSKVAGKILGGSPSANAAPPSGAPKGAPKLGAVEGGYVFMGGDPGKQSSWKKVQ